MISFVAAYLLWPAHNVVRDFPSWVAQVEAAVGGFVAAYIAARPFTNPRLPSWLMPLAGVLTVVLALLLVCYATAWTYYVFYQSPGVGPTHNPITAPAIAFVIWVLYFFVEAVRVPEIGLLDFAAIVGAMSLVRFPLVRWSTWGCTVAITPLVSLMVFRSVERTLDLSNLGYGPSLFWPLFAQEAAIVLSAIALCWWIWRTVRADAKVA